MRIWVTTIISDHGELWNTAHTSEEEAKDSVLEYVKVRWDAYMDGAPIPADRDNAIKAWFDDYDSLTIEQVILNYEPRVLVIVSGGVADWETDPGVKVAKFDLDYWDAGFSRESYKEDLAGFEDITPDWIKKKLEEI
jgi:hypothetical protein